jgi:hypothetical protein
VQLGDTITYRDRPYVLVGIDPMSVAGRRAELEDEATGDRITVLFAELERGAPELFPERVRPRLAEERLS